MSRRQRDIVPKNYKSYLQEKRYLVRGDYKSKYLFLVCIIMTKNVDLVSLILNIDL